MFDMNNAKFEDCHIQMNENDGVQVNVGISEPVNLNISKICSELECIASENENVKKIVQEIKSEMKKGGSKNKIHVLLDVLKDAISVATIVEKFPNVVDNVKSMIEKIIG